MSVRPPLPAVNAPWIVGRETLLEYAADEFLNETARQRPWRRARYETLMRAFIVALDPAGLARLRDVTAVAQAAWLATLDAERRCMAADMLAEFREYVADFGWHTR